MVDTTNPYWLGTEAGRLGVYTFNLLIATDGSVGEYEMGAGWTMCKDRVITDGYQQVAGGEEGMSSYRPELFGVGCCF